MPTVLDYVPQEGDKIVFDKELAEQLGAEYLTVIHVMTDVAWVKYQDEFFCPWYRREWPNMLPDDATLERKESQS